MQDPTICRQIFNVNLSVESLKNRNSQCRRAARWSKERMKKLVKKMEMGLALAEAETAAQKLDMADKYKIVAEKLYKISKVFIKAEANKSIDEPLKLMLSIIDKAVRSMDLDRLERSIDIYNKYFEDNQTDKKAGGEGRAYQIIKQPKKTRAEELLEGVLRQESRQTTSTSASAILVPTLAINLAKKEKPIVENMMRQLHEDKYEDPEVDMLASALMKKSTLYLPEFDI